LNPNEKHNTLQPVKARKSDLPINDLDPNTISLMPWEAQADYFAAFPFTR